MSAPQQLTPLPPMTAAPLRHLHVYFFQIVGMLEARGQAPNITFTGPIIEIIDIIARHLGYW